MATPTINQYLPLTAEYINQTFDAQGDKRGGHHNYVIEQKIINAPRTLIDFSGDELNNFDELMLNLLKYLDDDQARTEEFYQVHKKMVKERKADEYLATFNKCKKKYKLINFEGTEYALNCDAYCDFNFADGTHYCATAYDKKGNEYRVQWDILASADSDDSDESNACDWDKPYNIVLIDTAD